MDMDGFEATKIGRNWLYSGSEARVDSADNVTLVGRSANVETGEPVGAAQLQHVYSTDGVDAVVRFCDQLAGRFLVLVESDGRLIAVPDGWASLQAYWDASAEGHSVFSSSPGLLLEIGFGRLDQRDQNRLAPTESLKAAEYRSVGPICPVSGAKRLLANHILDLDSGRQTRLPLRPNRSSFAALTHNLTNAIQGLHRGHRGEVWLPLTAGFDSRWVAFAASKADIKPRFFTFGPSGDRPSDAVIGADVAARLGADHAYLELPPTVSPEVKGDVTAIRGGWRDLEKMSEIEYFSQLADRVLVLNGNGGEILRGGYYGIGPRLPGRRLLRSLCLGRQISTFDAAGFERWYSTLAAIPDRGRVELDELYYWEERMSHWGSDFYAEKENYVDELSPFCCRQMLLSGPAVAGGARSVEVEEAVRALPPLHGIPVNPHEHHRPWARFAAVKAAGNLALTVARSRSLA